jgi:hypothetical protein
VYFTLSRGDGHPDVGLTPEDRIAALEVEVNQELAAARVPHVEFVLDPDQGPPAAFDRTTWVTRLNPAAFRNPAAAALTPADRAEISGAIHHEVRHAEQWYEIARLLAGAHGLDAARIHARTSITLEVCRQAAAAPALDCTMSTGPAYTWYQATYGS